MIKMRECKHSGCHNLTTGVYCELHKGDANRNTTSQWAYLYHTAWWAKNRKQYLIEHPFCAKCGKPASTVHHKIEHQGNLDLFYDKSNWESLCSKCHSKEHYERREGIK